MDTPAQPIPDPNSLHVRVVSGDETVYEGEALSVSSRNEKGRFDILPYHTNFISIVKEFVDIQIDQKEHKQVVVKTAIMRVYENNVQVFLGVGE